MKNTINHTIENINLGFLTTIACALLIAAATVAPAAAGTPPPGWIFELTPHTVVSGYQPFTTSFIPGSTDTYVSFMFREDPAFFAFDDVSVTHNGNPALQDGDFSAVGNPQWSLLTQTGIPFAGIFTSGSGTACSPNAGGPISGGTFWCDGSVGGYDGIYQLIHTPAVGQTYNVSFYLGDNSGTDPIYPGIDMFVYAGAQLPGGTHSNTPEPGSLALFGSGVLGVGGFLKRRLLG